MIILIFNTVAIIETPGKNQNFWMKERDSFDLKVDKRKSKSIELQDKRCYWSEIRIEKLEILPK